MVLVIVDDSIERWTNSLTVYVVIYTAGVVNIVSVNEIFEATQPKLKIIVLYMERMDCISFVRITDFYFSLIVTESI